MCSLLAQFGWAAALTREGVARTDVLAVSSESSRTVAIQVKTAWCNSGQRANWLLGAKGVVSAASDSEWYVLVKLEGPAPARHRHFVVPRDHVAAATWVVHRNWLTDPEVPKGRRNTPLSLARVGEVIFQNYEDRWDLLEQSTQDLAVMLPSWCRSRCLENRVGLPPDHPWNASMPEWLDGPEH